MGDSREKSQENSGNTVTVLLNKQHEHILPGNRVKVVIVGCGYAGVASGIAILFKVQFPNFTILYFFKNYLL